MQLCHRMHTCQTVSVGITSHHTEQTEAGCLASVFHRSPVKKWQIPLEHSFTARMRLLIATNSERRHQSSAHQSANRIQFTTHTHAHTHARTHARTHAHTHTHTHPFNGPFSGTTQVSRYQKGKPIWILLKQETVSGSGISWDICESAPNSRQITTPAPHRSVFLQARCPSCCPTNSVKALKAITLKAIEYSLQDK